eukprot:7497719-Pyramimonas_sp.AAC.1
MCIRDRMRTHITCWASGARYGALSRLRMRVLAGGQVQEQQVMVNSMAHLTRHFGRCKVYQQYLWQCLVGAGDGFQSVDVAHGGGSSAEVVLFEKEADNNHVEELFIAQVGYFGQRMGGFGGVEG